MDGRLKSDSRQSLDRLVPSDLLPQLVALTEAIPVLAALRPQVLQKRLVFDANRVHAELRWRLTRRKSPSDRSAIHEPIIAGVVVLFAPEHLKAEIAKHLGDIARDTGVSVSDVEREWELIQKHLCFYEPKSRPSSVESCADVDDFPYLATSRELDTQAVYTSDRHLAAMQAPVVSAFIDTHLRDYARASSVQIVLHLGSSFSVVVSWEFLSLWQSAELTRLTFR
jgi:predicted nucleic acid-binding protein